MPYRTRSEVEVTVRSLHPERQVRRLVISCYDDVGRRAPVHALDVLVLDDAASRARGVLGATSWGELDGVLFWWPSGRRHLTFHTVGMRLPAIDLVGFRGIVGCRVWSEVPPDWSGIYFFGDAVLELPAGRASRMGLPCVALEGEPGLSFGARLENDDVR